MSYFGRFVNCFSGLYNVFSFWRHYLYLYLASAGETGGMIGQKFGLGWPLAFPVIRQKDDILLTETETSYQHANIWQSWCDHSWVALILKYYIVLTSQLNNWKYLSHNIIDHACINKEREGLTFILITRKVGLERGVVQISNSDMRWCLGVNNPIYFYIN